MRCSNLQRQLLQVTHAQRRVIRKPIGETNACMHTQIIHICTYTCACAYVPYIYKTIYPSIHLPRSTSISAVVFMTHDLSIFSSFSICMSISISISIYLSICSSIPISMSASVCITFTHLPIHLFICLATYLPACLSTCLSIYLSIYIYMYIYIYVFATPPMNPTSGPSVLQIPIKFAIFGSPF